MDRKGGAVPALPAHLLAHPQEPTAENGEEGDCGMGGPRDFPWLEQKLLGEHTVAASPPNGLPWKPLPPSQHCHWSSGDLTPTACLDQPQWPPFLYAARPGL